MTQLKPAENESVPESDEDTAALRQWTDRLGIKRVIRTLERAEQESMLKPFQAELILMQKYLEEFSLEEKTQAASA